MSTRTPNDLYPTTPEAAAALDLAVGPLFRGPVVDPTAGYGTLLEWSGVPFEHRRALDLSDAPEQRVELERRLPREHIRVGVDSLHEPWPRGHIVANPPFVLLDAFVERIIREVHDQCVNAAILTPVGFWHAQSRASLRPPSLFLALGWRPNFSCGLKPDGSEGSSAWQDYVWAVYEPFVEHTRWRRVERPQVDRAWVAEHERLARIANGATAPPPPLFRLLAP